MPLYEYICPECGHEFEELTSFSTADKVDCENCGVRAERLASCFSSTVDTGKGSAPACKLGGGG